MRRLRKGDAIRLELDRERLLERLLERLRERLRERDLLRLGVRHS